MYRFFALSEHVTRPINSSEVTAIKRRRKKRKAQRAVLRDDRELLEYWPQTKCECEQCALIERQPQFEDRRFKILRQFKQSTYEERVNQLAQHIIFPPPTKKKAAEAWSNGSPHHKNYPANRVFRISGFGFGEFTVCFAYLKWFYAIGKESLRKIIKIVWDTRQSGCLRYEHVSAYKGFKNTECVDQPWLLQVIQWILDNIALTPQHYVSSNRKNGTVYMEMKDGEQMTFEKIWHLFMKETQPAAYAHYVTRNEAPIPTLDPPSPSMQYFCRVLRSELLLAPKRFGQDVCNACSDMKVMLERNDIGAEKRTEIEDLLKLHEIRWNFMYSLNSWVLKQSTQSWLTLGIEFRFGVEVMHHARTSVHFLADYGLDRPELITSNNACYFKRKIGVKHLNVLCNSKPCVFVWSGLVGGKAYQETVECLDHLFSALSCGAERGFATLDGAMISYDLLRWLVWIVHPKNPQRRFKCFYLLSLETGHSYLKADTLDHRVTKIYRKRNRWSKCAERVKFVNEQPDSDILMIQMHEFHEFPEFFKKIFVPRPTDSWRDERGVKAGIQNDKPLIFEFGVSEEWDGTQFRLVEHYDQIWMRVSEDFKVSCRKLGTTKYPIFQQDFQHMSRGWFDNGVVAVKDPPTIDGNALMDCRAIMRFFPNKEELLEYYTPKKITWAKKKDEVKAANYQDYSAENTLIKMKRRVQQIQMIKANKTIELTKYKRNATVRVCNQSVMKWSLKDLEHKDMSVKDLKVELKAHSVVIPKRKSEMISALRTHYESSTCAEIKFDHPDYGVQLPTFPDVHSSSLPLNISTLACAGCDNAGFALYLCAESTCYEVVCAVCGVCPDHQI